MWCVAVGVPVTVVGERVGRSEADVVDQIAAARFRTARVSIGQRPERETDDSDAVRHQIRARVRLPWVESSIRGRMRRDRRIRFSDSAGAVRRDAGGGETVSWPGGPMSTCIWSALRWPV